MEYIIEEAQRLFKRVDSKRIPVNLEGICAYLGIEVRQAALRDKDGVLLKSGFKNLIIVNKNQSIHRKRFTIGHELGHYVREHECVAFSDGNLDAFEEWEANIFASELLMPTKYLLHLWAHGDLYTNVVASVFNVSNTAASIAIEQLYRRHTEILTIDQLEIKALRAEYDRSFDMKMEGVSWPKYLR